MPASDRIGVIRIPVDRLHIELTNHCNFSCEFCPDSRMARKRGFMEFETLKRVLDEVAGRGLARTVFFHVMGEPLLYPRLAEAVGYADRKGLKTCVTTNGSLLTPETLDSLVEAGISRIILSLQTPDERTFGFRGAKGVDFEEYGLRIREVARKVIAQGRIDLSISFLSSPLRRLIFPVMPEVSIADESGTLRTHLVRWAEFILRDTALEGDLEAVRKRLKRVRSFRETTISIGPNLSFMTRIMGDWAVHSIERGVRAKVGFCPGIQENLGILWNGDVVFCCVDYEGKTTVGNVRDSTVSECLASPVMQGVVKGFNRLRVIHPHCQLCMGDKNLLNAAVRQIGSIVYFKGYRKIFSNNKGA